MTPYLPALVCIAGLILWLAAKDKPSEAGRILFFCGLLVWLFNGGRPFIR